MSSVEDASKKRLRAKTPPQALQDKAATKPREKKEKKAAEKKEAGDTSKKRSCEKLPAGAEQLSKKSKTPKPSKEAEAKQAKAKGAEKKPRSSSSKAEKATEGSKHHAASWKAPRSSSPTSSQQRGMAELMEIKKTATAFGMTVDAYINQQSRKELAKQLKLQKAEPKPEPKLEPCPNEARYEKL